MTELLRAFDASLRGRSAEPAIHATADYREFVSDDFAMVHRRALKAAALLRARGLEPGDRCVVHLPNNLYFIDLFLGCLATGVVMVPANILYKERELAHIVADAEPKLILTAPQHVPLFPPGAPTESMYHVRDEMPALPAVGPDLVSVADAAGVGDDSAAVMIYTSGTTGRPKGAVLSHANFHANTRHLIDAWRITNSDVYLGALPLFHVHGLGNGLCSWLASGCQMWLVPKFDATEALRMFELTSPTLFFGVPTMYVRMLEWPDETARRIGQRMRLFVCGSAPLPSHVLEAFRAKFGHTILERYGMSETLMNLGNPYDGERRPGSVGVPFARVETRIVDDAGAPVGDNVVGQLEVRGPNVFREYWRNPEATAKAFRDGWFRTGDMAERAADGYFTLRGRSSDLIISGGFNIYPREIEELLLEQPGVREAAVVGANDPRRGEVPIAYVVMRDGADANALRETCARSLASFKVPRAFIPVDTLPRTALGKVQKHLLPPWTPE